MQLGTRWTSGDQPPTAVPAILHEEIAAVDRSIGDDQLGQPRPRWTLTWLEGRPVAELENGVVVRQDRDGDVVVGHLDDDGLS
ncbi:MULTISPECIES: hypothetical protein [unclassified Microbacterium]|uniref:hypothetical protein n=1 Tax=unclassified Microbacterium TaxID=2609290 RepID=UPI00386C7A40